MNNYAKINEYLHNKMMGAFRFLPILMYIKQGQGQRGSGNESPEFGIFGYYAEGFSVVIFLYIMYNKLA